MSERKCNSNATTNQELIAKLEDGKIISGLAKHSDPNWWKDPNIARENQAYLRRWGAYLRREARRRGLL